MKCLQGVAPQAVAHVSPLTLSTQPNVFGVVVVVVTVVVVTVVVVNGLLTPQPVVLQQHSRVWKKVGCRTGARSWLQIARAEIINVGCVSVGKGGVVTGAGDDASDG
jgi:hypothetical protein